MENKLEQYYLDRFTMFSSQGWKDLIEDIKSMEQSTNNLRNYPDEKSFYKAKGELSIIDWFLQLEEVSNTAYKALKEE